MAFMTHPKHGATHTNDVAAHEAAGWTVSTYEAWLAGKTQPEPVSTADVEQAPRRRGRKPKQ